MFEGYLPECDFCKIAAGEAPAHVVYESNEAMGFLPLSPAAIGHTLVIPKKHVPDLWNLRLESATPVIEAALILAEAIKVALCPEGMNLINSAGEAASQTVFHLHFHLVPRWTGDKIGNIWPVSERWNEDRLVSVANAIRNSINRNMPE